MTGLMYYTFLVVGLLVGMTGVGGILVPPALILMSGMEAHTAMGTALASFLPLGLLGTVMYCRSGHMEWRKALPFLLGGLAALPGSLLAARVQAGPLVVLLACLIIFAGACALRPPPTGGSVFWRSRTGFFLIGGVTGILAGMTGAGGPVLSIPWMVVSGVQPISAVALSMPYQVVMAFFGTVGNCADGHVDFSLLAVLCGLELAGFAGGVVLARRVSALVLRRAIGVLCCGLGVFLLFRQAGGM